MTNKMNLQLFAAATNTTVAADLEPAISVDFTSRISQNIDELRRVLGISELVPMSAGTDIKIYKISKKNSPAQVGEGENINLTEIERKLVRTITLDLNKYRKNTTAEAIQKVGRSIAINQTDEKLIAEIQKDIKKAFYTALAIGYRYRYRHHPAGDPGQSLGQDAELLRGYGCNPYFLRQPPGCGGLSGYRADHHADGFRLHLY